MCGIAGFVGLNHPPPEKLTSMLDSIVHRGPNSEGTLFDGPLAMGMRRLSIIDLAGGDQPISNEDRSVWTVSNGEIYNYRSVRKELKELGHRFVTLSDTEVIVHAYEQWGEQFVDHLEGMFGTAIWDSTRQKLLLIRDRLGIKPLYFCWQNGVLAFGSEMKCLFAGRFVEPEVDLDALQDYLAFGYAIAPRTIARAVEKLAPGELLVWDQGLVSKRKYWRIPDTVDDRPTYEKWRETSRVQFTGAIESHLIADVPLGSFLSGGVDSSGIVAAMDDYLSEPINTYSIGYRGSEVADYYNELPYAAEVADAYRTNHREIEVQPDVTSLLPKLMWHLEEPISDTATMTTYLVSKMAKETVTVIMSGVGGDELFAGYRRYLGHHYNKQYMKVPRWFRAHLLEPVINLLPSGRSNRLQDLGRYAQEFTRSVGLNWREQYAGYVGIADENRLSALTGRQTEAICRFMGLPVAESITDPLLQLMHVDLQTQLPEALLLLSDKMTMANSLECRVPFLHHPLTEFAATIPTCMKAPRGKLKKLLKDTLRPMLPEAVLQRSKRGFGAPVGSWLQSELVPLTNRLLSRSNVERRGFFDPNQIDEVLHLHRENRADYTDLVMVLMNLEIWCQVFQDQSSPEDISLRLREEDA